MDRFLNVLICPHQRRKHVQAELERLTPGVMYMGRLDMSELPLYRMEWAERREGVFVRWRRAILDTSVPRILSGRLNCPILLAYICDEAIWGYALFYKGSPVDQFRTVPGYLGDGFADDTTPERRAARLTRHFPVEREDILEYLTPWSREEPEGGGPQGDCWQLEDFLNRLVPWAGGLLTSDQLTPTETAPAADPSSPQENAPDRMAGQLPPEPEPGPEACLPFLTGVRAQRRGWSFPLSLLYRLFPKKRPVPETVPHQGWTVRELGETLERFYSGELDRLELDFAVHGEGTYIRRLKKTMYQTFRLTLELIREEGRCMCLLLDDQKSGIYRLIADREVYMTVDTKELERTVFHGQRVEGYVVFPEPAPEAVRRELPLLLARLDRRDDVLSPTRRMGVWSGEVPMTNTEAAKRQHQENRKIWCLE